MEDPYAELGVAPSATAEEIKKAYRRRALECHPDKNRGKETEAAATFARVREALRLLEDADARMAYDALAAARQARERKLGERDQKRRRMVEELEKREREGGARVREEEEATRRVRETKARLQAELERLRRKGGRENASEGRASSTSSSSSSASAGEKKMLRVVWDAYERDYNVDELRRIFGAFGEVEDVVRKVKKRKGSALVAMVEEQAAERASLRALGDPFNPLKVSRLSAGGGEGKGEGGGTEKGKGGSKQRVRSAKKMVSIDFEEDILAKMRREGERTKVVPQMEEEGEV